MAIAIEGRLAWRREAPFHIQMTVETRAVVRGWVHIEGKVVRVFRTDGRLKQSDVVRWEVWVCRPGGEPTGPAYIYEDDLARASFIEAYLHGTPPNCELAAYEFTVVDAPTEQPILSPAQLEDLLTRWNSLEHAAAPTSSTRRRWWQFWRPNRSA